jgi:PPP family 3-phenylpropionic acid transporter
MRFIANRFASNPGSALWASNLLLFAGYGSIQPLLPVYLNVNRLSTVQIGVIFSLSALSSSLLALYFGRLSDVYGRKPLLAVSTLTAVFVASAYPENSNFASLLILVICFSTLMTICSAVSSAFAVDLSTGPGFGKRFGGFRTAGALGWIPGTLIGGVAANYFGIKSIFYLAASIYLASFFVVLIVRAKPRDTRSTQNPAGVSAIAKSREIRVLFLTLILVYVAQSSLTYFLPLYLHQKFETPPILISSTFTLMAVAEIPVMKYFGAYSDKLGRKILLQIILLCYPLRIGLTAVLPSSFGVILTQMLHGVTFGGLYVVSTAYMLDVVPPRMRGISLSLYPVAQSFGLIIGSYLSGALVTDFGFSEMYMIIALYSLLPFLLFTVFGKETTTQIGMPTSSRVQ